MQWEMADFAPVPPPGKLDETYVLSLILLICSICENMTHQRTESQPQVTLHVQISLNLLHVF